MKSYPNVKINLGLHVLRKRPDGFHDLETLFVPCDAFHDVLEIEVADRFDIHIDNSDWDPQSDLTAKAYRLLKADFPDLPPVRIRLYKGSPVGAGLGGGSADCAFALRMMNGLFALGLSDDTLAAYAARLGSDCAFFVYNRPMFARGRGEILEPFDLDLSGYDIRVAIPEGVHVSTREAYAGVTARCALTPAKLRTFDGGSAPITSPGSLSVADLRGTGSEDESSLASILALPVEEWKDILVNDFEPSVFKAHPEIEELKRKMYEDGAVYAAMSGSGSAVFGLFRK